MDDKKIMDELKELRTKVVALRSEVRMLKTKVGDLERERDNLLKVMIQTAEEKGRLLAQAEQDPFDHDKYRRGRPPISAGTKRQIRQLRAEGHSIRRIADEVGLSFGSVQKVLKDDTEAENEYLRRWEKESEDLNDRLVDRKPDWLLESVEKGYLSEDRAEDAWQEYYDRQMTELKESIESEVYGEE